jgi:hypothetical protein
MIQPELGRYRPVQCDGMVDGSAGRPVGKTSGGTDAPGNDLGNLAPVTGRIQPETQRCPSDSVSDAPASSSLDLPASRLKIV